MVRKKVKKKEVAACGSLEDLYLYLCKTQFLEYTDTGYKVNLKTIFKELGGDRESLGNINEAMLRSNKCIALIGLIVGQVMYARDGVKDQLSTTEATVYTKSKQMCEESGLRRTERQLDGEVRLHRDVESLRDELAMANQLLRTLQSVQESVLRRDRALEQISNNERLMHKDEVGA